MAREINLVPDIKGEMIKTLKLRNFIFFLCIVIAAAGIGSIVVTGLIAGGQQIAIDGKKGTIDKLSEKVNSYGDLNDFLTIRDQLGNISTLTSNKNVMSRTFNILSALIPTGADTVEISELNVSLESGIPTFTFDAQANAGAAPYIDYNVLDSFKKSMKYMRYDYGRYVDREGNVIPAYCVIENGSDGATFRDGSRGYYGLWTVKGKGCNPSSDIETDSYATEDYNGEQVVRIWRTPQFDEWYKPKEEEGKPYMDLNGNISNVEHFESACITYRGEIGQDEGKPKWNEENDSCLLVPNDEEGNEGITIYESSNGRDDDDQLVLRFSATIIISPEAYKFSNTHMLALAPSSRRNVTDSYVQVQAMFGARAKDCAKGDAACESSTNTNGGN